MPKGGVAARSGRLKGSVSSSRNRSTSYRLRQTNNSVNSNSHGQDLQAIKKLLMFENPVCGHGGNGKHGCGRCLLPHVYNGVVYGDHITPVSQGGATTKGNVQLLCFNCHSIKAGSKNRAGSKLLKAGNKSLMKRKRKASKSTKTGWGENWKAY